MNLAFLEIDDAQGRPLLEHGIGAGSDWVRNGVLPPHGGGPLGGGAFARAASQEALWYDRRMHGNEYRYATSGDLSIAFATDGHGSPDLVFADGFASG